MKSRIMMVAAVAAFAAIGAFAKDDAEAALKARLPGIFAKAAAHYRALDAAATPLMKGKVVAVCGFKFKILIFFERLLPRSTVRKQLYRIQKSRTK